MKKHLILWADDDPDDMTLFRRIVEEVDQHTMVLSTADGREVLGHLDGMRQERNFPCLVILDLNMPALGGRETIGLIKEDNDFASIPVAVFTTSGQQVDRNFCDRIGVPFFTKPSSLEELKNAVQKLLGLCSCYRGEGPVLANPVK